MYPPPPSDPQPPPGPLPGPPSGPPSGPPPGAPQAPPPGAPQAPPPGAPQAPPPLGPPTAEPTTPLPASPVPGPPASGPPAAGQQPYPTFQPGVASPTYGQPQQTYPPTTAFTGYQPVQPVQPVQPARAGRSGGSSTLLWALIAVFSLLLCSGAGVAGVLAYRNSERAPNAQPSTAGPTAPPETDPPDGSTTTPPSQGAAGVVTYEVTGDGPAAITYLKDGKASYQRIRSAQLPWQVQVPVPEDTVIVSLVASRTGQTQGSITCRVLLDGQVAVTRTANGRFATVACIDLLFD